MKKFGLIGRRLGHSYSQEYFTRKFAELGLKDYSYALFELPSVEGLKEWALREGLSGFNVTVPYKQEVIPQLDAVDEVAAAVGAVNCVTVETSPSTLETQQAASLQRERGETIRLIGHNTDAPAFQQTLEGEIFDCAYILGTGGAARAVAYALGRMGVEYKFVSRHPQGVNILSYEQLVEETQQAASLQSEILIINATPVGMFPDVDNSPLELNNFQFSIFNFQFVYDLIYNPSPTLLLRQAAERGARTKDGLEMLHRQADLSWEIWKPHPQPLSARRGE